MTRDDWYTYKHFNLNKARHQRRQKLQFTRKPEVKKTSSLCFLLFFLAALAPSKRYIVDQKNCFFTGQNSCVNAVFVGETRWKRACQEGRLPEARPGTVGSL